MSTGNHPADEFNPAAIGTAALLILLGVGALWAMAIGVLFAVSRALIRALDGSHEALTVLTLA